MEDIAVLDATFGGEHFGAAQLGDRRRTRRLVELANRMANHPGGTLPDKVNSPASLKALYRLMDCEEVTHRSVLESPRQRTLEKMAGTEGTVLVIHDGTELDFTGLKSIANLGQIGNGGNRGYVAHNVLAVVAQTREVLGLAYQHLARRPTVTKKETRDERRDRADRESRWWKIASKHIPAPAPGRLQVEVADRGADVLEFLDFMESAGKHYLVRSKHSRRISLENGEETKLHDFARKLPECGRRTVEVAATAQRPARTAVVAVSWAKVTLLVPAQPRGEIRGVPLTTWIVRAAEIDRTGERGTLGMDSPDQHAGERCGGCERADRLVSNPLDRGGVPQGIENGLPDRRDAVHHGRSPSTGYRIDFGCGSESAATARRQSSTGRGNAFSERPLSGVAGRRAQPLALRETTSRSNGA